MGPVVLRFVFRSLALLAFVVAILHAVIDITRTLGAGQIEQTLVADSLARLDPELAGTIGERAQSIHPMLNDPVLATALTWPTWSVFAGLAFILFLIGRKRASSRFAAI